MERLLRRIEFATKKAFDAGSGELNSICVINKRHAYAALCFLLMNGWMLTAVLFF